MLELNNFTMSKVTVTKSSKDSCIGEGLVELFTGGLLKASQSTTYTVSEGSKSVTFNNREDAMDYTRKK